MIPGGYKLLNNAELGSGLFFLVNCCPTGTSAKLANASNYFTIILQAALLALKSQIPRSQWVIPRLRGGVGLGELLDRLNQPSYRTQSS